MSGPLRLATLRYDYRNQMVEYEDIDFGGMWRFQYDALGRRVSRSAPNGFTTYVNGGQASWQVLAEYDGVGTSSNLLATHVYGNYIDEPIQMSRDFVPEDSTPAQHFYYHQDDLFNVVALTAGVGGATVPGTTGSPFAAGAVIERVRYGDYGAPEFINAAGTSLLGESPTRNPYLFTGREWDGGMRFYNYRTRYMEPTWGRFTTRDSIGTWGDAGNIGSAVSYSPGNPNTGTDPIGLCFVHMTCNLIKQESIGLLNKVCIYDCRETSPNPANGTPSREDSGCGNTVDCHDVPEPLSGTQRSVVLKGQDCKSSYNTQFKINSWEGDRPWAECDFDTCKSDCGLVKTVSKAACQDPATKTGCKIAAEFAYQVCLQYCAAACGGSAK